MQPRHSISFMPEQRSTPDDSHPADTPIRSNLASLIPGLLPHLDAPHPHLPILLPRGPPLVLRTPELAHCRRTPIDPRFAGHSVLEPAIRAADRHVEDEIERLVERGGVAAGLAPRIHQARSVGRRAFEIALRVAWAGEGDVQGLDEARVDVGEQVLLAPFEAEGVPALGVGRVQGLFSLVGFVPCVVTD